MIRRITSINVANNETLLIGDKTIQAGIFKRPVSGEIRIHKEVLLNEAIVHAAHHGGVDQAVYLDSRQDYEWWQRELGRELPLAEGVRAVLLHWLEQTAQGKF